MEQIEMDLGIIPENEANNTPTENIRVRRLTEKENWRLMGFTDQDYDNATKVNSSSQLNKQAGNSICVNCLEMIFGQMFEGKEDFWKRWTAEKCFEERKEEE